MEGGCYGKKEEDVPMKMLWSCLAVIIAALSLSGCQQTKAEEGRAELIVFAAASLTETMEQIAEKYQNKDVELVFNFDSSGTLKTQIEEGADCDLFISAGQKQMNQLDIEAGMDKNPQNIDRIDSDTRVNLLENEVVLCVPKGNPAQIYSFEDFIEKLRKGEVLAAIGNQDVPVGQYSQDILKYFGLDEKWLSDSGCITYAGNVKEVVLQIAEASVDCGIVYATDAHSAELEIMERANPDMCGQVLYPAAVVKNSRHPKEAEEFLLYLQGEEAMDIFRSVGFSPAGKGE